MGVPYYEQLARKRKVVEDALSGFPELAQVAVPAPWPAPRQAGYRIQSKLAVAPGREGPLLGIYQQGTHVVTDIRDCAVHHPLVANAIKDIAEALAGATIPIHDPAHGRSGVRYLLIRASELEQKVAVMLVSSLVPLPRLSELVWTVRKRLPLASFYLNVNRSGGNVILGRENIRIWGRESLPERYGKLVLDAPTAAFVQANPEQASRIYRTIAAKAEVSSGSQAVDLYCGVGGIALTLASRGASVTGIEEVPEAVKFARANARSHRLATASFACGRVEERLTEPLLRGAEVVTANPPRKGLDEQVLDRLAASNVPRILYLSCWPASFARDAAALAQRGFVLNELQPFDMMPQTEQIEVLGVFARRVVSHRHQSR